MRQITRAFTLVELLVVMAVLGALCAILFPVFVTVRGAADKAACISNLRNLGAGTHLYAADYDDRLMPVNHAPPDQATSRNDRTWVQNLLPYVTSFSLFRCPADHTSRPSLQAAFDQDLVPGDTDSQYYTASLRSNYGYNFQNLAPIIFQNGAWNAQPRSLSQLADWSSTLLFLESVWAQTPEGEPTGGGSWLVTPPCRYYAVGHVDSFTLSEGRAPVYTTTFGWNSGATSSGSNVASQEQPHASVGPSTYGNAWPWHFGHVNVAMVDGSVRNLTPAEIGAGCDVKDAWKGLIFNRGTYLWDVN